MCKNFWLWLCVVPCLSAVPLNVSAMLKGGSLPGAEEVFSVPAKRSGDIESASSPRAGKNAKKDGKASLEFSHGMHAGPERLKSPQAPLRCHSWPVSAALRRTSSSAVVEEKSEHFLAPPFLGVEDGTPMTEEDYYALEGVFQPILKNYLRPFSKLEGGARPSCFLCYAWPEETALCDRRQAFVRSLRYMMREAGIDAKMDIVDNTESQIGRFRSSILHADVVVFIATEDVMAKYERGQRIEKQSSAHAEPSDASFAAMSSDPPNIYKEIEVINQRISYKGYGSFFPIVMDKVGRSHLAQLWPVCPVYADFMNPKAAFANTLGLVHSIYKCFLKSTSLSCSRDVESFVALCLSDGLRKIPNLALFEEAHKQWRVIMEFQREYQQNLQIARVVGIEKRSDDYRGEDDESQEPPTNIEIDTAEIARKTLRELVAAIKENVEPRERGFLHYYVGFGLEAIKPKPEAMNGISEKILLTTGQFADEAFSNAISFFQEMATDPEDKPRLLDSIFMRGKLRYQNRILGARPEEGIPFFQAALALSSTHPGANYYLARIMGRQQKMLPLKLYTRALGVGSHGEKISDALKEKSARALEMLLKDMETATKALGQYKKEKAKKNEGAKKR